MPERPGDWGFRASPGALEPTEIHHPGEGTGLAAGPIPGCCRGGGGTTDPRRDPYAEPPA
ncbi:hypothetical protein Ate01nite_31940 [Actinoplanes teichomyceticus]|nr:hypothetical protein Ate01nite_31940 [Actinoplanes teichomyceticus]